MMPRCSGNFRKISKKTLLVESFWIRDPEMLLKEGLTTDVSYLGKLLKMNDFWQLLLNSYRRLLLMYFNFSPKQFLSAVSFCNVTRNVNKKFLQIALLETTPYKISILVSFLEDVTHYFQWFTPAESTTGLTTVT